MLLLRRKPLVLIVPLSLVGVGWLYLAMTACACSRMWSTEAMAVAKHAYDVVLDCRESGKGQSECTGKDLSRLDPWFDRDDLQNRVRVVPVRKEGWRVEVQVYERDGFDGAFFMIEGEPGLAQEDATRTCVVTDERYRHVCPDGAW